jgi:hypothetical protein
MWMNFNFITPNISDVILEISELIEKALFFCIYLNIRNL